MADTAEPLFVEQTDYADRFLSRARFAAGISERIRLSTGLAILQRNSLPELSGRKSPLTARDRRR